MVLQAEERQQLKQKANEIRKDIVKITYTCGGTHIGGSLSQTDLIVALYYKYLKFNPENPEWEDRDRFLLSKGHGGVGHGAVLADVGFFPRSALDDFNKTGSPFGMHLDRLKVKGVDASTGSLGHGLGIANGMAHGARLLGKTWRTYVLLGDGELNGGPTWEAAMATGHFKLSNLTAFVDRNLFSIDGPTEDIMSLEPLQEKWSAFGWNVLDCDGHDFDQICEAIEAAHQEKERPTVIIARTIKGKGVDFMENQPAWHYGGLDEAMQDQALDSLGEGIDIMAKGLTWTLEDADHMTQAEIYGEVLTQLGAQNERILALTADLAGSTKIGRFQAEFPDRFINLGIAEMNMMGMASGLASVGFIPVVSTFAVFASLRCAEFVRTDICYQNRNVKIIATHSGTSFGQAGTTHHCTEDLAVMRSFSNMKVIAPADSYETAQALTAAVDAEGPIYIRIGRSFEPPLHKSADFDFEIGKAIQIHEGTDITVIACGRTVLSALEAAEIAKQQGLSVRVLDMHTIKPIDVDAVLAAVGETRRIVTAEDHNVIGGLGSAVAEVIAASGKGCVLRKLGLQDEFSIVGYPEDLLHRYQIDGDGIAEAIGQVMKMDFEADEDWEDEV